MRTAEHNAKIAAALRGKPKSAQHRQRLSEAKLGKGTGAHNPNWRGGDWYYHSQEKARVVNATKLAQKHGVESTLTLEEWLEIIADHSGRCAYCLKPTTTGRHQPNTLELDHVVSMAKGGPNTRENVTTACRDCNRRKTGTKSSWLPHIASKFWPRIAEELYANVA